VYPASTVSAAPPPARDGEGSVAEADAIVAAWDAASTVGRDAAIRTLSPSADWDVIAPVVG